MKPGGSTELMQANAQGFRALRNYDFVPPPGILRVAAFGDSFTHCDEVEDRDTWAEKMSAARADLEALNFGVGGYGPGQAFLRYRHLGASFNPHVVLIGFMSENIHRATNRFRPFYFNQTTLPMAKPRFVLREGELILLKNPLPGLDDYRRLLEDAENVLPRVGEHDLYYRQRYREGGFDFLPSVRLFKVARRHCLATMTAASTVDVHNQYNPDSEAFRVSVGILEKFYGAALRNDSLPVIVLFPNGPDLQQYRQRGTKRYQALIDHLASRKLNYVDLHDAFSELALDDPADAFSGIHYSPLANETVARYLVDHLGKNQLFEPEMFRQALGKAQARWLDSPGVP